MGRAMNRAQGVGQQYRASSFVGERQRLARSRTSDCSKRELVLQGGFGDLGANARRHSVASWRRAFSHGERPSVLTARPSCETATPQQAALCSEAREGQRRRALSARMSEDVEHPCDVQRTSFSSGGKLWRSAVREPPRSSADRPRTSRWRFATTGPGGVAGGKEFWVPPAGQPRPKGRSPRACRPLPAGCDRHVSRFALVASCCADPTGSARERKDVDRLTVEAATDCRGELDLAPSDEVTPNAKRPSVVEMSAFSRSLTGSSSSVS
jgi:hypothetical protein